MQINNTTIWASNQIKNVPNKVLLQNASKVERLLSSDVPPEQHDAPLTEDQIALRRLWRIFSKVDVANLNVMGRDGTPLRFLDITGEVRTATSPSTHSEVFRANQSLQASVHAKKMAMLGAWMKQVEILRTNEFDEPI